MADVKLFDDGYAVVETNHVAAVRTGQIKAQYEVAKDGSDFQNFENGMLLVVDDVAKDVDFPAIGTELCYLHASEERIYDPILGRKSFILKGEFDRPKMYKLSEGDIFETNAVVVNDADFADLAAAKAGAKYGVPHTSGRIELLDETDGLAAFDTHAIVLEVVEFVTLPNEHEGIKFAVAQA